MSEAKNSGRLPAFQFYPADWRKDPGVQSLDFETRGIWWEIICLLHESDERGVLLLNGQPMPETALCRLLGLDNQKLTTALTTLLTYGVAKRRESDGAIYSKRMVADEKLRQIRKEAGSKGGNPLLVKQKPTTTVKQKRTPSSSSSSSSSSSDDIIPPAPPPVGGKGEPPKTASTPDPRHSAFIHAYAEAYEIETGSKYVFQPRDAKTLQTFLGRSPATVEQMMTLARWAWERSKQPFAAKRHSAATIHDFLTDWQTLVMDRRQPQGAAPNRHAAYTPEGAMAKLKPGQSPQDF